MSRKMRLFRNVLIAATGLLVLGIVLALGSCCKPDASGSHRHASAAASGGECCAPSEHPASHEQVAVSASNDSRAPVAVPAVVHEHASSDQPQANVAVAEQTTCPVMGGTINKAIFVEHQGQKVYFCCGGCPGTFKADPAKYVAKLPQFQK